MWITSRYTFDRRRRSLASWQVMLAGLLAVVLIGIVGAVLLHKPSPLPSDIAKKVDFTVYFPGGAWQVEQSSISYLEQAKALTMTATEGTISVTITQQATPDQFNDVPQYYPTLLSKLNQYDSFGGVNGKVYLTHPKELNGATEAVLNHNGTFMLVYAEKQLSKNEWRSFFNDLSLVK